MLLFNCGNLNTVTRLQAGTAMKLSSISNRDKSLFCFQKHANKNTQPVLFNWSGDKQPEREANNHQRHRPKMKDQLAVTAVTVHITAVVSARCTVTFY